MNMTLADQLVNLGLVGKDREQELQRAAVKEEKKRQRRLELEQQRELERERKGRK